LFLIFQPLTELGILNDLFEYLEYPTILKTAEQNEQRRQLEEEEERQKIVWRKQNERQLQMQQRSTGGFGNSGHFSGVQSPVISGTQSPAPTPVAVHGINISPLRKSASEVQPLSARRTPEAPSPSLEALKSSAGLTSPRGVGGGRMRLRPEAGGDPRPGGQGKSREQRSRTNTSPRVWPLEGIGESSKQGSGTEDRRAEGRGAKMEGSLPSLVKRANSTGEGGGKIAGPEGRGTREGSAALGASSTSEGGGEGEGGEGNGKGAGGGMRGGKWPTLSLEKVRPAASGWILTRRSNSDPWEEEEVVIEEEDKGPEEKEEEEEEHAPIDPLPCVVCKKNRSFFEIWINYVRSFF
jgi:hypothetical protein